MQHLQHVLPALLGNPPSCSVHALCMRCQHHQMAQVSEYVLPGSNPSIILGHVKDIVTGHETGYASAGHGEFPSDLAEALAR